MLRKIVIGCTLAAAIVVVVGLVFYMRFWPKVQRQNAALLAYAVEEALVEFHSEKSAYPAGSGAEVVAALLGKNPTQKSYLRPEFRHFLNDDGQVLDPWKNLFRFEKQPESGGFKLVSAGPNGTFGDEDDLGSAQAQAAASD
ncbi:MAG: hypothetical protein ACI8T1_003071 [Verrucomicrobiales bacterium]|jgi:hypothetical protein